MFPFSLIIIYILTPICLSALHNVEGMCHLEDNTNYKMDNTSNLHGLLNLPEQIKKFGPLRMYWEGGYKGEGILRSLKPLM